MSRFGIGPRPPARSLCFAGQAAVRGNFARHNASGPQFGNRGGNGLLTAPVASRGLDVAGHCAVAQYCRYPVALRHRERVGSPGVDRRDHAVPVLPPLTNHRIDGLVARCGAWALGRD
ncbi:MAG: hypothetical protein QOD88_2644 [Mycobacterium sp.]|nr:hypothetical protein [Mycobacterium sp.]